jgi:hypothetical protein
VVFRENLALFGKKWFSYGDAAPTAMPFAFNRTSQAFVTGLVTGCVGFCCWSLHCKRLMGNGDGKAEVEKRKAETGKLRVESETGLAAFGGWNVAGCCSLVAGNVAT